MPRNRQLSSFTSLALFAISSEMMASDHVNSDPSPQCSTTVLEQDSLSPDPQSQENVPQVAETEITSNELASRPDIVHATCYCARYKAKPTEKHLTRVKGSFGNLKTPLTWVSGIRRDTVSKTTLPFLYSNHAGCSRFHVKSTSGGIQFLGGDIVS
ncbi:hypothetical protein Tco_0317864 [Tanacetum coccineum]